MKNKRLVICIIAIVGVIIACVLIFTLSKDEKWIQEGSVIKKGNISLEIGDYYDYDESNDGKITGLTDVKWKVLGVEDDNLLIMSSSNVESLTLGKSDDLTTSQQDYIVGDSRLNAISEKYGSGKGAIGARSINNDDLIKFVNVDMNFSTQNFGNITYYWTNEENPKGEDENGQSQIFKIAHEGIFIWFDKNTNKWNTSTKTGSETNENPVKIATLYNNKFAFNYENYNESVNEYVPIIDKKTKEFEMLFLDEEGNNASYWTSDKFIDATTNHTFYGYNVVKGDSLNYTFLVYSHGFTRENTFGVRAVVTID